MKTSQFSILIFLVILGLILNQDRTVLAMGVNDSSIMKDESYCEWPGNKLLEPGFVPMKKTEDGKIVKIISAESLREWKNCAGEIKKADAARMLRKLKQKFLSTDGGQEILESSHCRNREILEIFDPRASPRQAEKAGRCLAEVYKEQDSAADISGVVRVDEDCETDKSNMIQAAQAIVIARAAVATAAVVCCAATPEPASKLFWCGLSGELLADLADAAAELYAAEEMECPQCSDDGLYRMLDTADEDAGGYRKRFLKENYSQFHA